MADEDVTPLLSTLPRTGEAQPAGAFDGVDASPTFQREPLFRYGDGRQGGRPGGQSARPTGVASQPIPSVAVPVGGGGQPRQRAKYKSAPLPELLKKTRGDAPSMAWVQGHSYLSNMPAGYDASDDSTKPKGATFFQAAVNTTKLVVGVGSFSLPQAFRFSGMWGGILGVPLLGLWAAFAMKLMVDVRTSLGPGARYFDCGRETFGKPLEVVMYLCAVFASVGSCAGYIDFMAPLLVDIAETTASHAVVVAVVSPVFVLLCWIRSFRYLAFTSVLGDIAFVLAMATVFVWGFENLPSPDFDRPALQVDTYPSFVGSAVFLYGICLFVMPVQQGMAKPQQFMPSVYASFTVTTVLNVVFGAVGYGLWGNTAKAVIISNLHGGIFPKLVKILLTLDLTFSFPIVMSPARDLTERFLLGANAPSTWAVEWKRNGIRLVLVGLAVLLAVGVPSFSSVVGLVSGLALIATALVFPPMCYWKHFANRTSVPFKLLLLFLIVFGSVLAVFTTYEAAKKIKV